MPPTACDKPRTLLQCIPDMGLDLFDRLLVDQWSLAHAFCGPLANPESLDCLREFFGKGVVDALLHEQPVGADAGLARVAVLGCHGAGDGRIEIGIIEDNEGSIASELQRHLLDRPGGVTQQQLADLCRARKRELPHERARSQFPADRRALHGRDEIDDTCRESGTLRKFRKRQRTDRREFRGLDDDRTTGSKCRGALARDHCDREIPGRDRRDHTDRLADHDIATVIQRRGDYIAIDTLRLLGEPLDERGAIGDLAARLGQRLALLSRHQSRKILAMLDDQLEPATQDGGALLCGFRAPFGKSARSSLDCRARLIDTAIRNLRDLFARGRIVHSECLPGVSPGPFAIDQAGGFQKSGIIEH